MNCKHCKYWRRGGRYAHFDERGEVEEVRISDTKKIGIITDESSRVGMCVHPANFGEYALDWRRGADVPQVRFDGVCDSGEGSFLEFGEDFGCIHFQPKP